MPFAYPPDPAQDIRDLYRRSKRRDTVRDAGYTSISPGEGAFEVRGGDGRVLATLGHAETIGVQVVDADGALKNIVDALRGRDARLDQHDRNDASHQGQLNTLVARADQGDRNDASHQQQLDNRYTKGEVDSRLSARDSAISAAQSAANAAASTANAAASTNATQAAQINNLKNYLEALVEALRNSNGLRDIPGVPNVGN